MAGVKPPASLGEASWLRRQATPHEIISSMTSPIVALPLAGQVLGSSSNNFVIAEWQDAGGVSAQPRFIAPLHLHRSDDEAWYVLEGVLRVKVGNDDIELRAGSGVLVNRGTPHTYWNPGPGRVRYLLVMTSRIYQLIQDMHAIKDRTPAAVRGVFEKHDSELLG